MRKPRTYYVARINPCYVCSIHGDRPDWLAVRDIDLMHLDAVYPIYTVAAYNKKEAVAKAIEIEETRENQEGG